MTTEFKLDEKIKELILELKIPLIYYSRFIELNKEAIRLLKEEVNQHGFNDEDGTPCIEDYNLFEIIKEIFGDNLI